MRPALVGSLVNALRSAPAVSFAARDVMRASGLPLRAADNAHVASDLAKIRRGTALSPILLVRGDLVGGRPLVIADGYHRVCACYLTDENAETPARLVDMPAAGRGR